VQCESLFQHLILTWSFSLNLKTLFNQSRWLEKWLVLFVLSAFSGGAWADAPLWNVPSTAEFSPERVLVKFKKDANAVVLDNLLNEVNVSLEQTFKYSGVSVLRLKNNRQSISDIVSQLKQYDELVEYAEPNYTVRINATFPNDPKFNKLWGLHNTGQSGGTVDADIDAPEAWDISTGAPTIVVGVIDTGIDYTHEDLAANVWVNPGEVGGTPNFDDDGNGYVDDIHGINAITGTGSPMDDNNHGTHVSGTIGAVGDNNTGVVGVNSMPLS